jgi:hypothetical protein
MSNPCSSNDWSVKNCVLVEIADKMEVVVKEIIVSVCGGGGDGI